MVEAFVSLKSMKKNLIDYVPVASKRQQFHAPCVISEQHFTVW